MISEMHYDIFKPMEENSGTWCHMSDYWMTYHLIPCLNANCAVDMFERKGMSFPVLLVGICCRRGKC